MTEKPDCPQCSPYILEMEPGTYYWCACGKSQTQPFCDGSHSCTSFSPQEVIVDRPRKFAWCGCKQSKKGALCDGTHKQLNEA